ncbi:GNAT family N-acetyltransferase [Pseudoleptotrichia goodfellowii]|uniref:GCN5-related N-acetyltransferase n=1 Tax=Pseudoleptotrichia goodfellowii TaxID=157692 RepID=A0A510JB55_9FUSO|nr:GNAT family N-acetyltransferase [Pseudoleptotrichia goodfellowii]BBM36512.1 GCN5-related N-acetyltransferase [Pseudoleptotrichia goodfellowii]
MYEIEDCNDEEKEYLISKLVEYNLSKVPATQEVNFVNFDKKIKNEKGEIIAGIISRMYCWNCIYVDTLWVSEKYRGKGIGEKLLKEVEKEASINKLYLVHLDTFDFQAKDFYERYGYEVFGVLNDCPENHIRYFMKKFLKG